MELLARKTNGKSVFDRHSAIRSVHTSANLIFHFATKTEKENYITYPYHIYEILKYRQK